MTFIQPPDLGADLSSEGKRANRVKGMARAKAKPNMPTAGATMAPCVLTATSRKPMMGPVHENDTRVRVNAMKKMLSMPLVVELAEFILLLHDEGSCISKAPKKEAAKSTSMAKNRRLNTALVLRALSVLAPKSSVTARPSATYMTTMLAP